MKNEKGETEEEVVKTGWRTKRRDRREGMKRGQKGVGECQNTGEQQPKSTFLTRGNSRQFSKLEIDIKGYERPKRLSLGRKAKCSMQKKQSKHKGVSGKFRHGHFKFLGRPERDPKITNLAPETHGHSEVHGEFASPPCFNPRPRGSTSDDQVEMPRSPRRREPRMNNLDVKGENSTAMRPEEMPDTQRNTGQESEISMSNEKKLDKICDEFRSSDYRKAKPKCEGNHELQSHDVDDHEIEHHDVYQYRRGRVEREGTERSSTQCLRRICKCKTKSDGSSSEEEPKCEGSNVLRNHDVNDHAIAHHEIHQRHQGETDGVSARKGFAEVQEQVGEGDHPWTAPRVMWQYLERRTNTKDPTTWSIDDYDGKESWQELGEQPNVEYTYDREMSSNQYDRLTHTLYQLENVTDYLINKQESRELDENSRMEWQAIRDKIKVECMNVYDEIEGNNKLEDIDVEKRRAQEELN